MSNQPMLAVMLEPATYMLDLLRALDEELDGNLSACFVAQAISQPWEAVPDRRWSLLPRGRLQACVAIIRRIWSDRPSLVVVAGWADPVVVVSILAARLAGSKVIALSDTWRSDSRGFRRFIRRRIMSQITHFAPGGNRQKNYLLENGIDESRITPGRMTVDINKIFAFQAEFGGSAGDQFRQVNNIAADEVVCLFVGRLSEEKGISQLLESYACINQSTHACRLVIVGDGPMKTLVRDRAAVTPGVVVTGRLSGNDLLSAYAAADIFVGASTIEAWGLVVNEAMAFGLAVIVTDCYGCADELIIDGVTGRVAKSGDIESLVDCIQSLVVDESQRKQLGASARALIASWTIQAQARNIAAAWHRIRE